MITPETESSNNVFKKTIIDRSKPYVWAKVLFLAVLTSAIGKIIGDDNILGILLVVTGGAFYILFIFQVLVNLKNIITHRPVFNLKRVAINISLLLLIGLFQQLIKQLTGG